MKYATILLLMMLVITTGCSNHEDVENKASTPTTTDLNPNEGTPFDVPSDHHARYYLIYKKDIDQTIEIATKQVDVDWIDYQIDRIDCKGNFKTLGGGSTLQQAIDNIKPSDFHSIDYGTIEYYKDVLVCASKQ